MSTELGTRMAGNVRTREARLRNTAKRRGLQLIKSRRRDPLAIDYGKYLLVKNPDQAEQLFLSGKGMTLEQIEEQLSR